jgi:signal transduction histidine kinase
VIAPSLIAAETLVLYPVERVAPGNGEAAVYLLGIVLVALAWGFWPAAATSVVSTLAFDYFYVPPAFDISPTRPEDAVGLGIFLVVALLTSAVADLARSRAIEVSHRRKEVSVLAEQQAALRRVATLVARGVDPSEVFAAVVEEMARCLDVVSAQVIRYDGVDEAMVLANYNQRALHELPIGEPVMLDGDNVAAMVLHTARGARMDNYENATGSLAARVRELGIRSVAAAPVMVDGRVWGAALVGSRGPEPLPADIEERISDFADLVATAIANAATRAELIASRARIVGAADNARRRLERDLHDGAQQRLVSLGLQLRLAESTVPTEFGVLRAELSDVVGGLTGVLTDLQEISRGIHPAILSEGGLGPALKTLARRSPIPVKLDLGAECRLSETVEVGAYYVVAEALTNAAKHARASEVNVGAKCDGANLSLLIRDDGTGGADPGNGSGLVGLIDRVEALGGDMKIESPRGIGTTLHVTIPVGQRDS